MPGPGRPGRPGPPAAAEHLPPHHAGNCGRGRRDLGPRRDELAGVSRVVAGDPYELRILTHSTRGAWKAAAAELAEKAICRGGATVRPDRDTIGTDHPVEVDETLIGGRTHGRRAVESTIRP